MSFTKVIMMLPEVKRASLGSKVVYKAGACTFKTTRGKKLVLPVESILFQDSKAIFYRMPRRKVVKGEFELKDGFLIDSDTGTRIRAEIMAMGEEPAKKTAAQRKADAERAKKLAEGRKKKASEKGSKKTSKKKKKLVIKK